MSNKSSRKKRLEAQKQKQDRERKELEEFEKKQAELAKTTHSKSVEKMTKKAQKHKKKFRPFGEPLYFLILKILMIVPFAYSGFFYGGVLVAGVFGGAIDDRPPVWVGWCALVGILLLGVGIFLAFFRKYIISFIFNGVGTFVFMKAPLFMIHRIQKYISERAVDSSLQNLDKTYMKYYYPILGVIVISAVLLISAIIIRKRKEKRLRYERDTAPVKSIVE